MNSPQVAKNLRQPKLRQFFLAHRKLPKHDTFARNGQHIFAASWGRLIGSLSLPPAKELRLSGEGYTAEIVSWRGPRWKRSFRCVRV
jgi:hypothetical protein